MRSGCGRHSSRLARQPRPCAYPWRPPYHHLVRQQLAYERASGYGVCRPGRYRRAYRTVNHQGFFTAMSAEDSLSAEHIAQFLQDNPSFFQDHADVFANLRVPHPNETRAISLGERQIMTLRARAKDLEWKLSGLVHNARDRKSTRLNSSH